MESDRDYFARRAAEEKSAALRAAHPRARAAHGEMAKRYDERLADMTAGERAATLLGVA